MNIELKPCPFCGGEANLVEDPHNWVWSIGCSNDKCLGFSGLGWTYTSEREAAEAWNTRAERTCYNDSLKRGEGVFVCSECGAYLDIADMNEEDMDVFYEPFFCPNCGAKVVDE